LIFFYLKKDILNIFGIVFEFKVLTIEV